jgi:retron-type reverse transcriptase
VRILREVDRGPQKRREINRVTEEELRGCHDLSSHKKHLFQVEMIIKKSQDPHP